MVEIDDQAAGVKSLWDRPYLDKKRVGHLRHVLRRLRLDPVPPAPSRRLPGRVRLVARDRLPALRHDLHRALHGTPQENKAGYDAGSAMTYADKLKGRLMLYYGTADNNVHPSNTCSSIQALQRAGKSFEVQVGPDAGHSGDLAPTG